MKSLLFVCMGNICRSPMAQVVMEAMVSKAGLTGQISVDSAGTHAQPHGEKPDPRAVAALLRRGYEVGAKRSRRVTAKDFARFDLILAMDTANLLSLQKIAPPEYPASLGMFMDSSPESGLIDIPDPYYGNEAGFDRVLDLCETGASQLLLRLT
jgi:protein-tyrosine phosphatase